MFKLKEASLKGDTDKIIASLIQLRKISKSKEIDKNTFEILINLIKVPNPKVISYTLSILANCCLNNYYRIMFKEMGGLPHLLLVVRSVDNDSILCRACRFIGNLAINSDLAKELCKNNAGLILLELIEKHENISSDTLLMVFRAIKKLWTVAEIKWKMIPDDLLPTLTKCLSSEDEQIVRLTIETLMLFTHFKSVQKNENFKVSKELFLKIIELSKKEDLNHLTVLCLSNLICNQTSHVWNYLEGSNIAELFIAYIQRVDNIDGSVYKAFHKLCTEGAIRNKVRLAGLLPKLIETCNETNVKKFLATMYLFQYDLVSMMACSQNPKFTSILIDNILLPGAIPLLGVLSRLNPPVKELVSQKNLDIIIKNKECTGILKNITRTRQFLQALLTSGRVWEIEKAGCSMEELGSLSHSEGLIIQLLNSGEKRCKENVSLAIPFLVKPRNFELLYKLLAHYQVITTILELLQENPVEERILASVIRLINIFRYNYHQSEIFFQDFGEVSRCLSLGELDPEDSNLCKEGGLRECVTLTCDSNEEIVTFELDSGSCVNVNKKLLCTNSPVLDSMLNGHFIEAQQEKVRLRHCSREALLYIEKLLSGEVELSEIGIENYLELISLSDRFLLTTLNNRLTENLKIDEASCALVYQWYRKAGYTKNNTKIRQKIYEFLFSSSERLLLAMKSDSYAQRGLVSHKPFKPDSLDAGGHWKNTEDHIATQIFEVQECQKPSAIISEVVKRTSSSLFSHFEAEKNDCNITRTKEVDIIDSSGDETESDLEILLEKSEIGENKKFGQSALNSFKVEPESEDSAQRKCSTSPESNSNSSYIFGLEAENHSEQVNDPNQRPTGDLSDSDSTDCEEVALVYSKISSVKQEPSNEFEPEDTQVLTLTLPDDFVERRPCPSDDWMIAKESPKFEIENENYLLSLLQGRGEAPGE